MDNQSRKFVVSGYLSGEVEFKGCYVNVTSGNGNDRWVFTVTQEKGICPVSVSDQAKGISVYFDADSGNAIRAEGNVLNISNARDLAANVAPIRKGLELIERATKDQP